MKAMTIGAVALFVATSAPAHADWQYTKWGMTPEQVAAASKGAVTVGTGDPGDHYAGADIGATGTYVSGDYTFSAVFYFVQGKLADIRLKMNGPDGYKLKNDLDGVYGKPFYESGGNFPLVTYHDVAKNNRVDLLMIGSSTTLEYRPLKNASASGL